MPARPSESLVRLRPGVRVSRRGAGLLQVGLHPDERLALPDSDDVRRLLHDLRAGLRPAGVAAPLTGTVEALVARGLAVTPDPAASGAVRVLAPEPVRASVVRVLAAADVPVAGRRARAAVVLHVSVGAEPRRADLDGWMRTDRPHLGLVTLAGRTRVGPFVVPGRTACQRCVDEHLTDHDPRHPLVLEQHHAVDPRDLPPPADLQLALAVAARDLRGWLHGRTPETWSATVELDPAGGTRRQEWRRHPRCGCAWGDLMAG